MNPSVITKDNLKTDLEVFRNDLMVLFRKMNISKYPKRVTPKRRDLSIMDAVEISMIDKSMNESGMHSKDEQEDEIIIDNLVSSMKKTEEENGEPRRSRRNTGKKKFRGPKARNKSYSKIRQEELQKKGTTGLDNSKLNETGNNGLDKMDITYNSFEEFATDTIKEKSILEFRNTSVHKKTKRVSKMDNFESVYLGSVEGIYKPVTLDGTDLSINSTQGFILACVSLNPSQSEFYLSTNSRLTILDAREEDNLKVKMNVRIKNLSVS